MTDAECKAIEQKSVEEVRKALKTLTSGEIYVGKASLFLNNAGYTALEKIEGLDLFWICDPLIKLAKKGEWIECRSSEHWKCDKCGHPAPLESRDCEWLSNFCPNCGADMRKGDTQ